MGYLLFMSIFHVRRVTPVIQIVLIRTRNILLIANRSILSRPTLRGVLPFYYSRVPTPFLRPTRSVSLRRVSIDRRQCQGANRRRIFALGCPLRLPLSIFRAPECRPNLGRACYYHY